MSEREDVEACGAISPDGAFICDRQQGHDGDHDGFELPSVTLDERNM